MISERMGRQESGRGRLNGMIFISLLFHAAVLSLLVLTPSFPSPKLTFGPVYTVALVNFSGNALEQKGVAAGAKENMAAGRSETVLRKSLGAEPVIPIRNAEPVIPIRRAEPVIPIRNVEPVIPIRSPESPKKRDPTLEKAMEEIRKRLDAEPVIPIRSLESPKKQDPTLEKAMEEIRKRAAVVGPTPKPQTNAGSDVKAMPEAKARPASPLPAGDADMNAKINVYYAMIWSRIKRGWALPQGILPGDVLEAVIDVTILRNGAVTEVNFEKRSGNRFFDDSALKAIRKASPFPPLPASSGEASLSVGIRFHSSELRP